jgi:transcriptional repressor NrdR
MIVVKNNNSKEVYSRDKLTSSIVRSCSKSKISAMIIDAIIDRVEAEMYKNYSREIPSSVLGEMVMSQLQKADPMSYLRYASIFKKFTSIGEFIDETKGIEDSLLGLKFEESDRMKLQGVKPAI